MALDYKGHAVKKDKISAWRLQDGCTPVTFVPMSDAFALSSPVDGALYNFGRNIRSLKINASGSARFALWGTIDSDYDPTTQTGDPTKVNDSADWEYLGHYVVQKGVTYMPKRVVDALNSFNWIRIKKSSGDAFTPKLAV